MIFARTTSGDDLREQIDRDAFAMRSYACYIYVERKNEKKKEKRKAYIRDERKKNRDVHARRFENYSLFFDNRAK